MARTSLWLLLPLLLTGCFTSPPAPLGERLTQQPCWFESDPAEPPTRCYFMTVPEDHHHPEGRSIRFPVVIFSAERWWWQTPPAPVLHLGGGGPGSAVGLSAEQGGDWLRNEYAAMATARGRDLIVIDPRGVGQAQPTLNCPEFITTIQSLLAQAPSVEEEQQQTLTAYAECRARLVAGGIDPAHYTSADIAADVELLRQALGVERWYLYGVSYASRYALTVARDHPQGVAAMVLDGTVFPQVRYAEQDPILLRTAINRAIRRCTRNGPCAAQHPHLEQSLITLLQRLDAEPIRTEVDNPWNGEPITIAVTGRRLSEALFLALYDDAYYDQLPNLISQLSAGDQQSLQAPLEELLALLFDPYFADGVQFSSFCAEELPFADLNRLRQGLDGDNYFDQLVLADIDSSSQLCQLWQIPAASTIESQPVVTAIPTLLLHGALDPVLPAEQIAPQLRYFSDARLLIFPQLSHSVLSYSDCATQAVGRFFDSGWEAVAQLACLGDEAQWVDPPHPAEPP